MQVGRSKFTVLGMVMLLAVFAPAPALADSGEACATSYEAGQQLVRRGMLVRARAEFGLCRRACPTVLVDDCDRWLADVERRLPTIVPHVRDALGRRASDVRLLVDGVVVAERASGSVAVDPGAHALRFERADGASAEFQLVVAEAERDRPIAVRLSANTAARRDASRDRSTLALGLGGLGLAGLTLGGVLVISGSVDRAALERDCAPYCSESDVDSVRTQWWVGGISAALGATALGAAAIVWFTAPTAAPATAVRFVVVPGVHGADAVLGARF